MTRVSHGRHAVAPTRDERTEELRVGSQDVPIDA